MSVEKIERRLLELYGDQVTLVPGQVYVKMLLPLKFCDRDYGEWQTAPNNILNKGCVHPKRKQAKREQTNLERYGVANPLQDTAKVKAGMLAKHGVEHPSQDKVSRAKSRQTNMERYGAPSPLGSAVIQEKVAATLHARYGVEHPMRIAGVRERQHHTLLERYGEDNASRVEEFKQKKKETNRGRYGGGAPANSPTVQAKMAATNRERYGVKAPLQNADIKQKVLNTNLDRYGVPEVFMSPAVQEKIKKTCLERFGCEFAIHSGEIQAKIKTTLLERYGEEYALRAPAVFAKTKVTLLARYGVENPYALAEVRKKALRGKEEAGYDVIYVGDATLGEYIRGKGRSDLNYTSCAAVYRKYGLKVLDEYLSGEQTFSSSLEVAAALLLKIEPFRRKVGKRVPDFQLSDDVYLDVDGLYWHSTRSLDAKEHFRKRLEYENLGKRLIQFRENEIRDRGHIIRSLVANVLGFNQKVFARKCALTPISREDEVNFMVDNHLQGAGAAAAAYGLTFEGELLMSMSVRRKGRGIEISRLCTRTGLSVVGGFSRLLKRVIADYKPEEILSWCDLRYASGKGYEKQGFKQVRDVLGWSWTDYVQVYNRLRCRANMDCRRLSEKEHAAELGWVKIYDAGQRLYRLAV